MEFSYKRDLGKYTSYNGKEVKFIFYNSKEETGGFTITKRDADTKRNLEGVTFLITTNKNATVGWNNYKTVCDSWKKTDSNGIVKFSDLKRGNKYYIWEYNRYYGYSNEFQCVGEVSINDSDNKVTVYSNYKGTYENVVYNKKLIFKLTKKQHFTDESLSGVWFFITDNSEMIVTQDNYKKCISWDSTDVNGDVEFIGLQKDKTYYVWEKNLIDGYNNEFKKIGKVRYSKEKNKFDLTGYITKDEFDKYKHTYYVDSNTNTVYNVLYGKLTIRKRDDDGVDRDFKGIKFKIKDINSKQFLTINTTTGKVTGKSNTGTEVEITTNTEWDDKGKFYAASTIQITGIPAGKYQVIETGLGTLSDIYSLESDYVKIGNEGIVEINGSAGQTIMVTNKQKYGQLQIRKEDLNTKKPLEDFGFKIYSPAENGWIQVKKTNNGSYQIRGYGAFADAKVFTLDSSGKVTKAEEFTTDSNGETLIIKKIPLGIYYLYETKVGKYIDEQDIYKLGKKSVPERKQEENITVDANLLLDENGKEFKKIEVKSRYNLGGKTDLTKITGYNKQAYVDLSGYVWVDKQTSKAQVRNNHWKTDNTLNDYKDDQDTRLDGIKVMLKKKDGSTVKTATTANSGTYTFEKVLITELKNYYIEFEYEGLKYANVVPYIDDDTGSKAIEGDARTAFNKNFSVIEGGENKEGVASARYGYTKDSSGNKKYDLNYTLSNYTATLNNSAAFKINANTEKSGYNIESKFSYGDSEKPKVTEIKDINLGLYEREQPDISLVQDIQNVRLSINGQSHTYNYSSRFNGVRGKDIYDAGVRFGEKVRYPILFKSNI